MLRAVRMEADIKSVVCYFVRHGIAVDGAEWEGADYDRPLTEKGREKMTKVGKQLARLEIEADAIVSSPLVRARQTADILAASLRCVVEEDARLGGGFDPGALAGILRDRAGVQTLVLVGHEPNMSATVGSVIGGARIDFKKGAVACVAIPDAESLRGELQWLVPPKLFA